MIYFVQCESTGLVKIGFVKWAKSLPQRLERLRCDSPTPLKLLALIEGDRFDEQRLHRLHVEERNHGEWFALSIESVPETQIDLGPYVEISRYGVRTCPRCSARVWGDLDARQVRGGKLPSCTCRGVAQRPLPVPQPLPQQEALSVQCERAGVERAVYAARRKAGATHEEALATPGKKEKPFCVGGCGTRVRFGRCERCCNKEARRRRNQRRRRAGQHLSNAKLAACVAAGVKPSTYRSRRRSGIPHSEALDPRPRPRGRPRQTIEGVHA